MDERDQVMRARAGMGSEERSRGREDLTGQDGGIEDQRVQEKTGS